MADIPPIRAAAVRLCEAFLIETNKRSDYVHWRQIGFDHIAKDDGQGFGTTCGFLPHWLPPLGFPGAWAAATIPWSIAPPRTRP